MKGEGTRIILVPRLVCQPKLGTQLIGWVPNFLGLVGIVKNLLSRELVVPLVKEISIPISSFEAFGRLKDEPHSFFLDSQMDPQKLGRFSFMGSDPFLIFRSKGSKIEITEESHHRMLEGNPFDILRSLLNRYRLDAPPGVFPFLGGAVGYFAYDLCHFIEELPSQAIDDLDLPHCYLCFYDRGVVFDHLNGEIYLVSTGFPEEHRTKAEIRAEARLRELEDKLRKETNLVRQSLQHGKVSLRSNFTKEGYLEAVQAAREYIIAGDIFQVNLSQRFETALPISPFELYHRLRGINPAPFAAFLNFDGITVVSASPERFLRLNGGRVETRPIKGTRPRGKGPVQDGVLAQELMDSGKDKAEHIMIVDLERNDLGRVCEYGSVRVSECMVLETYATVFHLVSTIEGRICEDKDRFDLLKACFPGGSITGAPKVRAMEIIDELEPTRRNIYTGSIGYLSFAGDMDLSIVIRTFLITEGRAYFQVGGGIVFDSDPEAEYVETLDKAKALIKALNL